MEEAEIMKQITFHKLIDRERIKQKFSELLEELIKRRKLMFKRRSQHTVSVSDMMRLQEHFFWYIDNPNYKRTENKRI